MRVYFRKEHGVHVLDQVRLILNEYGILVFFFSLGAVHDGDDNSCRKTDYFIMSSENAVLPGLTARNPWIFSACSGSEIRDKLTQLNRLVQC